MDKSKHVEPVKQLKACLAVQTKEEGDDRTITFIGSTGDLDRDNEVLSPKGWDLKRYKKNPVFLWSHDYSSPPIGQTQKVWKEDDKLKFTVKFADADTYPFADTIFKLYNQKYLNSVSVGFSATEWKDGDPSKGEPYRTYTKMELYELSGVTVPSNYNALVEARDTGEVDEKEFNVMKGFFPERTEEGDELDGNEPITKEKKGEKIEKEIETEEETGYTTIDAEGNTIEYKVYYTPGIKDEDDFLALQELIGRMEKMADRLETILKVETIGNDTSDDADNPDNNIEDGESSQSGNLYRYLLDNKEQLTSTTNNDQLKSYSSSLQTILEDMRRNRGDK
jgi:HK97 family phage prohead protease